MGTHDQIGRGFRLDVLGELPSLRRYARTLARGDIDAEDLVHDALVRAYERRASFRIGHNLRVWLMSILHNVFIDGARARRAEVRRLARVGELLEQQLPPTQDIHVLARSGRRSPSCLTTNVQLSISLPSKVSAIPKQPRRLPFPPAP
jgi:DNA-directed RNA polymerase specialized sigma24 family protein